MRKVVVIYLFLAFCLPSCSDATNRLSVDSVTNEILMGNNIINSRIVEIGEYTNIDKEFLTIPVVTQKETEDYIELIKAEYELVSITDDFLKGEYGVNDYSEFEVYIYNRLLQKRKTDLIVNARHIIMERLINLCTFKLNINEVALFSLEKVKMYENEAYLYDMTLEDYCRKVLEIPYEELFERCYKEGEYMIKYYLVIGTIAYMEFNDSINSGNFSLNEYQQIENAVFGLFIDTEENF